MSNKRVLVSMTPELYADLEKMAKQRYRNVPQLIVDQMIKVALAERTPATKKSVVYTDPDDKLISFFATKNKKGDSQSKKR